MADDRSGPAFPAPEAGQHHFNDPAAYTGMTLRDFFAAKAMQSLVSPADCVVESFQIEAKTAYRIADAMLKERAK